jgi:hypothetical protein
MSGQFARKPFSTSCEEESKIPPATVASTHTLGITTVRVLCEAKGCWHDAVIPLDAWPSDTATSDIALELHCVKCGGRNIQTMGNMSELYPKARNGDTR